MCEVETPAKDADKTCDAAAEKARRKAEKARQKQEKKRLKEEKQRRLLFPADKKGRHVMHRLNFLRVVFYPVHSILYPFRMHGHTKVGLGPYIYVGNHFGLWDVFFPAHTTWEGIHYLAKDSVLRAPILGYWSRKLGVISAMRDGSDVRTLMEAMKVLKNGEKISMFPEGTRNKGDGEEMLPFHGGAALLAIKTKTPIIPFVICNRPKPFHMTHVVFGEPFELSEYYGKKLSPEEYVKAEEALRNRMYELRAHFRAEQAAKKAAKMRKKGTAEENKP